MTKECDTCGKPFRPKSTRSVDCPDCRKMANRSAFKDVGLHGNMGMDKRIRAAGEKVRL
jgi:hypothetical protein